MRSDVMQCVAACCRVCSALQRAAVCCIAVQCVAIFQSSLQDFFWSNYASGCVCEWVHVCVCASVWVCACVCVCECVCVCMCVCV